MTSPSSPVASARERLGHQYIVSRVYDGLFFIGTPVIAIAIGLTATRWADHKFSVFGHPIDGWILLYFFWEASGDVGYYRAYLNPQVFKRYWVRLTIHPALLFLAMSLSTWAFVAVFVAEIFVDIYHSALQTFGLARFYDGKNGNDPSFGRRLDYVLNLFIYAGPIVAGANLLPHVQYFSYFQNTATPLLARLPFLVDDYGDVLFWAVTISGLGFLAYYLYRFGSAYRAGSYRIPMPKVYLLFTTTLCCVWMWGFSDFRVAILSVNFFHALQYFALVWSTERKSLSQRLHVNRESSKKPLLFLIFITGALLMGLWEELSENTETVLAGNLSSGSLDIFLSGANGFVLKLRLVLTMIHYYHDSFIWSVRKSHV